MPRDHHGGREAKLEKGRELGADYGIDHYKQKISDEVRKITNKRRRRYRVRARGRGDLGGEHQVAQAGGTIVTCGATTGPKVGSICGICSRQLTLLGSYMGTMGELHEVLGHVFAGD